MRKQPLALEPLLAPPESKNRTPLRERFTLPPPRRIATPKSPLVPASPRRAAAVAATAPDIGEPSSGDDDELLLAIPLDPASEAEAAARTAARLAANDPVVSYDDLIVIDTREGRGGISNERLCARLQAEHKIATRTAALSNFDFWYIQVARHRSGRLGEERVHTMFERKSMADAESSLIGSNHWQDQIARLQSARGATPTPRFVLLLVGEWSALRRPAEAAQAITGMCDRLQGYYACAHVLPVAHDELLPGVMATSIRHAKEHAAGYRFDELPELSQLKRTMLRVRVETPETWSLFSYGCVHGVSVQLAKQIQVRYPTVREAMAAAKLRGAAAFTCVPGIGKVLGARLVACMAPKRAERDAQREQRHLANKRRSDSDSSAAKKPRRKKAAAAGSPDL